MHANVERVVIHNIIHVHVHAQSLLIPVDAKSAYMSNRMGIHRGMTLKSEIMQALRTTMIVLSKPRHKIN